MKEEIKLFIQKVAEDEEIKLCGNALTFILYKSYFGKDLLNDIISFAKKNSNTETLGKLKEYKIETIEDLEKLDEEQSNEVAMNETTEETEQQEETNSEAVLNDQEAESTNQEEEPTTDKKVESTPADTKIEQPTTSSDEENVKVVEKVVEVVKVVEVEKKVEVPKVVEVEKVVEVPKVVEVEKIVEVPKVVEVEKVVEVPKETITTSNPASTPTVPNYSYNPYGDPNW
jgi:hypothetical protein